MSTPVISAPRTPWRAANGSSAVGRPWPQSQMFVGAFRPSARRARVTG